MILSMRLEACLKDSIGIEMDEDSGGAIDDEMDKSNADMMYTDGSCAYKIKAEHGTLPVISEMIEQSDEHDEDEEYQIKAEDAEDDNEGNCEVSDPAKCCASILESPSGES